MSTRRKFIENTLVAGGAAMLLPAIGPLSAKAMNTPLLKDDISLAQWALVDEIREGKWKTLDFPKVAREDFNLNGIEFVNTLFEVPTNRYLNQLKKNADDHGVDMVLIMVDAEGDGAEPIAEGRKQFVINHQKWIDIAHYLGCHAIRTNCRGPEGVDPDEAMKWATESYSMLLDYARSSGVKVCIENHGGVSDDADWMVRLMKSVNSDQFGTYPDWRHPGVEYDNVEYLKKTIPYALGQSYRNQPTEAQTKEMIRISQDAGYTGWYGIESSGREAIKQGINILKQVL